MLDIKPQPTQAAALTQSTRMMWAWAFATARIADVCAARGLAWWSQLLRPAARRPTRPPEPRPSPPPREAAQPSREAASPPREAGPPAGQREVSPRPLRAAAPPAETTIASYRSDGGHAAAQVILGTAEPDRDSR